MDMKAQQGKQAVSDDELRHLQTLQAALTAGILVFLLVVLVIANGNGAGTRVPGKASLQSLTLLTYIHLAFAVCSLTLAPLLFARRLGRQDSASAPGSGMQDPALISSQDLARLRSAVILRLALWEWPALFGLVVLLLAAYRGALASHPLYWINVLSALIFIALAVMTFPTRDRISRILAERHTG